MKDFNPVYVVLDPDARAGDSRFRKICFTILVGHSDTAFLNYRPERIPSEWKDLREEARPIFERLEIVKLGGEFLTPIDLDRNPRS